MYAAVDQATNWNAVAVQATLTAGENAITQTRTLAIVQVAIHDALNSISPRYERYALKCDLRPEASAEAAVASAAHDALVGAISVGALPFTGFGTPASQALAVAQADAERDMELAAIPERFWQERRYRYWASCGGRNPGGKK